MAKYKIIHVSNGAEVLQPISETEYWEGIRRKKKIERKREVSAWIGSFMMAGYFFFILIIHILGV